MEGTEDGIWGLNILTNEADSPPVGKKCWVMQKMQLKLIYLNEKD
jgi:hypothetical protein